MIRIHNSYLDYLGQYKYTIDAEKYIYENVAKNIVDNIIKKFKTLILG